jgi:hypothetical protein
MPRALAAPCWTQDNPFILPKETHMSEHDPQDLAATESDELDVEELEDVAGGGVALEDQVSNTSCNGNCGC